MSPNDEEIEVYRQRAEVVVQAAAEGVFGSPRSDPVGIQFDWEVPHQARAPIVFEARVRRGGHESSIRFDLDLDRLQTDDLQTLHDFLARYHARVATHYELAWHLSWLIETWLTQVQPELTPEERHAKVREILLS
jgi:hypothetical protein